MSNAASRFGLWYASPPVREASFIAFGWILASTLIGVAALRTGISQVYVAWAIGASVLPAAATLILLLCAAERWSQTFLIFVWVGFAALASSATGGFGSPLTAVFTLAPAFAMRIGGRAAAAEAAFFAVLSYIVAGVAAGGRDAAMLGPLPACGAGLAILAAGALIAGAAVGDKPSLEPARAPPPGAAEIEAARREAAATIAAHRRRAAELAHELRTPLNHIIGFADAMRQRLFGPMHDRYGEYVDLIHTSGRNLLDLVNGLLDLSRLEAGRYPLEIEAFDFRFIAEEAVKLARDSAAAKSITLTLEADDSLPVNADPRALRQILTNLVANALKFTPQGGAVTARVMKRGGKFVIEVEDNGPGIPPAERARLGAPYERGAAGANAEGYGLGLSLVRALADAHGGKLSLHKADGGGALVRVVMPVLRA